MSVPIVVVVPTASAERAAPCIASWRQHAADPELPVVTLVNAYVGPVEAFRLGVEQAFRDYPAAEVIACFHDDLVIFEQGWDTLVTKTFEEHPKAGLVGFGGWVALGSSDLYDEDVPYDPLQLAGFGYRSGLTDAERWGQRAADIDPVVAVSRFSQIGRRAFWSGFHEAEYRTRLSRRKLYPRPWTQLAAFGIVDHFYAGALGCLARRGGWDVYSLPVRCRHLVGQTTNDPLYHEWADAHIQGGDRGFWEAAHRIGYENFRDVLPLRL